MYLLECNIYSFPLNTIIFNQFIELLRLCSLTSLMKKNKQMKHGDHPGLSQSVDTALAYTPLTAARCQCWEGNSDHLHCPPLLLCSLSTSTPSLLLQDSAAAAARCLFGHLSITCHLSALRSVTTTYSLKKVTEAGVGASP